MREGQGQDMREENAKSQCIPDPSYAKVLNFRQLIGERIDFYNRQARNLHALLRALPGEMPYEAEAAMLDLLTIV